MASQVRLVEVDQCQGHSPAAELLGLDYVRDLAAAEARTPRAYQDDLHDAIPLPPENLILAESRSLIEVRPQPRGAPAGRREPPYLPLLPPPLSDPRSTGRPPIAQEIRDLVRGMSRASPSLRRPRIWSELWKQDLPSEPVISSLLL